MDKRRAGTRLLASGLLCSFSKVANRFSSSMTDLGNFDSHRYTYFHIGIKVPGGTISHSTSTSSHSQWCQCSRCQTQTTPFHLFGQMEINSGIRRAYGSLATYVLTDPHSILALQPPLSLGSSFHSNKLCPRISGFPRLQYPYTRRPCESIGTVKLLVRITVSLSILPQVATAVIGCLIAAVLLMSAAESSPSPHRQVWGDRGGGSFHGYVPGTGPTPLPPPSSRFDRTSTIEPAKLT